MAKRYLYLIRNGDYEREDSDSLEGGLSDIGIRQAQHTASALSYVGLSVIHASPYRQVRETAQIIANVKQTPISETPLLRQYDTFAMKDGTLTRAQFLNAADSQKQQLQAASVVFIQPPHDSLDIHEAIVCHANIMRDLICLALGVNPASWAHMVINNCGISCLTIDLSGAVELLTYNDVNHLPDGLHTS